MILAEGCNNFLCCHVTFTQSLCEYRTGNAFPCVDVVIHIIRTIWYGLRSHMTVSCWHSATAFRCINKYFGYFYMLINLYQSKSINDNMKLFKCLSTLMVPPSPLFALTTLAKIRYMHT